MSDDRRALIRELSAELKPVSRPGRSGHLAALWLTLSWLYTLVIVDATGPWRPGALGQLAASPQFALEAVIGLACGAALVMVSLRLGVPDPRHPGVRSRIALAVTGVWVGAYVIGLWHPALEPSMLGKREHCPFETLLYAALPLLGGLMLLRRLMPLNPRFAGFLLGLAAGSLPALAMQFACMYTPEHTLTHHLAPALLAGALGAVVAPWITRTGPARRDLPHG